MPEPGESVEPLATRLIDATLCHAVELFAITGSVDGPVDVDRRAHPRGHVPGEVTPRNCTSVAPWPDTVTCVPVVSEPQVVPPSVDVR